MCIWIPSPTAQHRGYERGCAAIYAQGGPRYATLERAVAVHPIRCRSVLSERPLAERSVWLRGSFEVYAGVYSLPSPVFGRHRGVVGSPDSCAFARLAATVDDS
jgi:hypothetical protein